MSRWATVVGVLIVAVFAAAAQGGEGSATGIWDNAFVDFGSGYLKPAEQDSTFAPSVGLNMGFPLISDYGLGWQIGGRGTFRDDDPDGLASAGLFKRGVTDGGKPMLWGLQGFYQLTHAKADLLSIRPTLGFGINDKCSLSLVSTWGLNEEHVKRDVSSGFQTNQQPVDETALILGHQINDDIRGEALAGYQFGSIDEIVLGFGFAWMRDEKMNFNLLGSSNFAGDYSVRVGVSFDLGARGLSSHQIYVGADSESDYTPLPVDGLSTIRYNTEMIRF